MFCSNCGKELVPDARFCPNCGTPVQVPSDVIDNPVAEEGEERLPIISDESVITENVDETVEYFSNLETVPETISGVVESVDSDIEGTELSEDINICVNETEVPLYEKSTSEVLADGIETSETVLDGTEKDETGTGVSEEIILDNSNLIEALENTIPDIVSYGGITVETGLTDTTPQIKSTDTEELSINEDPVQPDYLPPVQIPAAYRASSDQPAYVQEQLNVSPPDYAQPASTTPLSVQTGQNPPKVKKSGKKSKLPLIIAILLILAAVIGYIVYQNSPSVKFDKAMTAGETAYESGDYFTALDEFQKAYDIRPDDEVAQADIFSCYDALAMEAYDNDDYSTCIGYYETAKDYCPAEIDTCDAYITAVYSDWCLNTASNGDIESAEQIYAKAAGAGYDMSDTRSDLDVIIETAKLMEEGAEAAQYIAESLKTDMLEIGILAFNSKGQPFMDKYIEAGGELPVIFDVEGCEYDKLGFYDLDGTYAFYFGEYSGDVREGHGEWYVYISQGLGNMTEYSMEGEWSGDVPNGTAREHYKTIRSMSDNLEWYVNSSVVNGLYNGTVTWDYTDDDYIFTGSFHNGIVDVIDTIDPNGNQSYVIAYNEDKSSWLYRQEDKLDNLNGIIGFN